MEKAFAYICADAEATPRLLRRYCRKVYELGYVPICPKLSEVQYLQPDNPDEKRDFHSMILTVYSRMFKLYMYTAIAPIPMSSFAGEPTSNVGKNFLRSYAGVCLEGAIIALACIIFSIMAASPPAVDPDVSAVTAVWSYVGELIFNLLVLVGTVRMSDRIVKELLGL